MDLSEITLRLFKAVEITKDNSNHDTSSIIALDALSHGVVIDPNIAKHMDVVPYHEVVEKAIKQYGVDPVKLNSTFYKRFSDVEDSDELTLRLEQLAHYCSTYGRGYEGTEGNIYEPEVLHNLDFDVKANLVYIRAITHKELEQKIKNMLTSGIALNDQDQSDLLHLINDDDIQIDYVDEISNREFMCRLCKEMGLLPANFDEFTRYLIYLGTNSTLLIKSKEMYQRFSNSWGVSDESMAVVESAFNAYVGRFGMDKVAQNITRYRKLYLILRKRFQNKRTLNKIMKLSKTEYKPRKQSPLENVLNLDVDDEDIKKAMAKVPVYKLAKIMNAVKRWQPYEETRYFKIRNGRAYLKRTTGKRRYELASHPIMMQAKHNRVDKVKNMVMNELKHRYNWSDKLFYIPEHINYAVPTSAKDFIGALPFMTTYDFKGDATVGISWEQHMDLDLHAMTLDGHHFGWNGGYRGEDLVTYSGDMTNTNKYGYAAEYFKIKRGLKEPLIIDMSYFSGLGWNPWLGDEDDSAVAKFDLFVTGSSIDLDSKQGVATQIDDHSMLVHEEIQPSEDRSKNLMVVIPTDDGFKIGFTDVKFGNVQVPGVDDSTPYLIEVLKHQLENTFTMNELIEMLGGKVISNLDEAKQVIKDQLHVRQDGVRTKNGQRYTNVKVDYDEPKIINLSPDQVTASDFIDLLTEGKND